MPCLPMNLREQPMRGLGSSSKALCRSTLPKRADSPKGRKASDDDRSQRFVNGLAPGHSEPIRMAGRDFYSANGAPPAPKPVITNASGSREHAPFIARADRGAAFAVRAFPIAMSRRKRYTKPSTRRQPWFRLNVVCASGGAPEAVTDTESQESSTLGGMEMKKMRKSIARVMDDAVDRGKTPSALALVWQKDDVSIIYGSGHADIAQNTPICRDTLFRLYSLTKPLTAVAAMMLVECGELDLLSPVSDFLEGFQDQRVAVGDTETVPVKRPVQVRDLFTMTSGLCYPGDGTPAERAAAELFDAFKQETDQGAPPDTLAVANRIGRLPLAFHPGESWLYGTSADILGAVVEVITGKPLDKFMKKALFAPLGMDDTDFYVPEEKQKRLATLYQHQDGGLVPYAGSKHDPNTCLSKPAYISGGGGAVSTIDDMLAFARMLLGKGSLGKTQILKPISVEWLTQNHLDAKQLASITFDTMDGYGYGGLMRVLQDPAMSYSLGVSGEFGWDGWSGTYLTVCPEKELIILVMQQCADAVITPLVRKIRNIVYSSMLS